MIPPGLLPDSQSAKNRRMLILLFLLLTSSVFGQKVAVTPPAFDVPIVREDRTVDFRVAAPGARAVALHGEWMPRGSSVAMEKQTNGLWSLTVGPLSPDLYQYGFEIDGLRVPDPANRFVKSGYPGLSSLLEVPGAQFLSIGAVPHGTVHVHTYMSRATNTVRRLHVYTPPGHDPAAHRVYPVLVLLHGSWDNDAAWIEVGRAGIIMDNLIAEKRANPMVIVMPDGHPHPSFDVATRPRNLELLQRDLADEILPLTERTYRVARDRTRRAIAGFSMGGAQALHLALTMGLFGSVGAFSAPGDVPKGRTFEEALRAVPDREKLPSMWLACGRDDEYFKTAENVHTILDRYGVQHVWRETDGAHTWLAGRRHLAEFASLLFRPVRQ
jgi:enterochelin esterase family protein